MKQRITQEQMDSLSDKAKIRLADWADPKDDLDWQRGDAGQVLKFRLPLLTIGQMIEFLDEHGDEVLGYESLTEMYGPYDGGFICKDVCEWRVSYSFSAKELCDALWEAVKGYLEKRMKNDR